MPNIVAPPQLSRGNSVSEFNKTWWAVETWPQREKQLARELIAREVDYYLPLVQRRTFLSRQSRKNPNGRWIQSIVPVYPRFVFINGASDGGCDAWYHAKESHGVLRIHDVKDQNRLIRDLVRVEQQVIENPVAHQFPDLFISAMVRIRSGEFEGREGELVSRNETELMGAVQMRMLGAPFIKHFPLSTLEVA